MRIPTILAALFATLVGSGCTPPATIPSCASKAREIESDPTALHCETPRNGTHDEVVMWITCVLGAIRTQQRLDGEILFVAREGTSLLPYVGAQRGSDVVFGPCPRIVLDEEVRGTASIHCGTNDYNPTGTPIAFPTDDAATLTTPTLVEERLRSGTPIVWDAPAASAPDASTECIHRALAFPNASDPSRCGLIGLDSVTDTEDVHYAGYTCHSHL